MLLPTLLLALSASIAALPSSSTPSLAAAQAQFAASEQCQLPLPEDACSGAARSDIIVTYGMTISSAEPNIFLDAARAAGGHVVHEWKDFGFSAFVPEHVVELMRRYGKQVGVQVHDNACVAIPV